MTGNDLFLNFEVVTIIVLIDFDLTLFLINFICIIRLFKIESYTYKVTGVHRAVSIVIYHQ
jgi:hypothetical protein